MGAAEARALWQRRGGASRYFVAHEDAKMTPRLAACYHQQPSSSGNTEKNSFSYGGFGDSSDTKWWLKEEITNSFFEDTKFVDLMGKTKEEGEEEDYRYSSMTDIVATTPWWKSTTDKDELALWVATRSVDHNIQNCDLPPPQKLHKSGEKGFKREVKSAWKQGIWSDEFEKKRSSKSSTKSDDISKAEILEALRHCENRGREAEKRAREACTEKERVITILMRQASQMLAYKQCLKLLLLKEDEEENEQIKGINLKKRKQRKKKKKKKKKKKEKGRYIMAVAIGFSFIGAAVFSSV